MKFSDVRFGLARSLVALAVSLALILSTSILAFASAAGSNPVPKQTGSPQNELQLTSASATATAAGVLLHWTTNSTPDNVGFNIYRVKDGRRTQVNREIIAGALFALGTPALMPAGYSYSWFDRGGTADCTYLIESVSVDGNSKIHQAIAPVVGKTPSGFDQTPEASSVTETTNAFEKQYPAVESQINLPQGSVQDQWAIAAQPALKIGIKKDGWYRVTQPQMVAAGFNPTVDIRNLRLFVQGNEVAIMTNQLTGPFGSGDSIEFYGQGLDIPTSDTRTYYLIAGTTPGKRVQGEIQLDGDPPGPTPTPLPPVTPPGSTPIAPTLPGPVLRDPIFQGRWANFALLSDVSAFGSIRFNSAPVRSDNDSTGNPPPDNLSANRATPDYSQPENTRAVEDYSPKEKSTRPQTTRAEEGTRKKLVGLATVAPLAADANASKDETPSSPEVVKEGRRFRKTRGKRKKTRRKLRRQLRQKRNHVLMADGFAAANFDRTIEIKDRFLYLSNLVNGEAENWFGQVISSQLTQTLTVQNPDLTAAGPATLEFALQGIMSTTGNPHQVSVAFNGVTISVVDFSPLEHPVRTFSIPVAHLLSGANTIKFTKTSSGELCLVDYVRLTYPHAFNADSGALRFNLRGNQTRKVDGFSTPSVRLIDYTDPLAVSITKPSAEPSASGYAITVPVSEKFSKDQRLFYATQVGQFDQPASLSLNQPSTLNQGILSPTITSGANFLIISHKNFIPSLAPLLTQRSQQGMSAAAVDIDDVYDEFSYGLHGPQAIRDFLQYASTHWTTPPHYVIFAGDASLDPRNYVNSDLDFVPTKLVDTLFGETASDDWLSDFDDDGIANIPVGRLPFSTVADANLVISKIVNFTPANGQSGALLVADEDPSHVFGFVETNDVFQNLLQGSMTVQRINRCNPAVSGSCDAGTTLPDSQMKPAIIAGFNQGHAVVSYSGHGNVDVWTGAALFASADATGLTNGNKLSFVVVMDCLNGLFQQPGLLSLSEALVKAPGGGAVAAFASSGLTFAQGQHEMGQELYTQLYGGSPIALGDAIKQAKTATGDIDVRRTWILFGDPSMKIR